jgi:hypothetical protein
MHDDAARIFGDEAERLMMAAGALEDAAAELLARSADLENQALAEVARFETQRDLVVDALGRLHAAELAGDPHEVLRGRFLAAEHEKKRLWSNVERLWSDSKRCLVRAADQQARAERLRNEATRLFATAGAVKADEPARRQAS